MHDSTTRRSFLQRTAGAAAVIWGSEQICRADYGSIRIEEPFHGAILNHRNSRQDANGLKIQVKGYAPLRDKVTINGAAANRAGSQFDGETTIASKENNITAVSSGSGGVCEHRIRVVWDRYSQKRYRFSIDDNSFFLRDIAQKKYKSLFDCSYLNNLRQLQGKYGTKFVLNVYYTTGDDFDISGFPESYKSEWKDNSNWLKLSFHANADKPARPYEYATKQQFLDFDKVVEQILRFAGEQTYSPPTVIHFAMVQPSALKSLAQRGVRALSGLFRRFEGGWDINYCLDDERSEYLSRHDALKDFDSGIIFSKVDLVCNDVNLEQIVPSLKKVSANSDQAEIMDIFTHEQYFWPFYKSYLPDHPQRLDRAIQWLTENGYKPVFFHEGLLGGRED